MLTEEQNENIARLKLYYAVEGVEGCSLALIKKQETFKGVYKDLRNSIMQLDKRGARNGIFIITNYDEDPDP